MKKSIFVFFALISSFAFAQKPAASPAIVTESANVKITYGQPSKKDREIFGKLVPFGEVWRTGANGATEVTFKKDVNFGGAAVKAGTYSLFTIPTKDEWTVILNSELKQWGAYGYDKVKDKNVASVKVKPLNNEASVEKLTLTAEDSQITISWDMTLVKVPLKW
ncbi:DUF2911 domain-containing protein [Lacihabitans sp. CCS-44]|uniref:DUF2911 domain-containing protein n=1 Tax=Lacihabitans sp. CCS-44 TaxID=2487331 RepID=UPI0020CF8EFB|nr:DUF2911 domain-containing protein [Lacihabitans sp. CCS-44]MCP9753864.1 DUF2911 domain-containing protein [Lacihabitans sp. CCS-44]